MTAQEKVPETDSAKKKREDRELDEGLDESFPASDPPASTQPGSGRPEKTGGGDPAPRR